MDGSLGIYVLGNECAHSRMGAQRSENPEEENSEHENND